MASLSQLRVSSRAPAMAGAAGGQARAPLASSDALVLQGVTRAFGALRAVDEVSFAVAAGQKYAVLGSNGAGKTTLFNAITGDFPPTAGRIEFFGEDITALPPHEPFARGCAAPISPRFCFVTCPFVTTCSLLCGGLRTVDSTCGGRVPLIRHGWLPKICSTVCACLISPMSP